MKNLNDKLVAIGKYIEVRAIGGYAMLYNGLRSGGYTVDVDTVTEDYSDDIKRLVVEFDEKKASMCKDEMIEKVKKLISLLEEINDGSFEIQDN